MDEFLDQVYQKIGDFQVGDLVEGIITRIEDDGVTLKISNHLSGWIHISEVSNSNITNLRGYFYKGQPLRARIISLNRKKNWFTLSVKQIPPYDRIIIHQMREAKNRNAVEDISSITDHYSDWLPKTQDIEEQSMIKLNTSGLLNAPKYTDYSGNISKIIRGILNKTNVGNDFLGWVDYPLNIKQSLIDDINNTANRIASNYDVLVVCGIGGSYLGTRAVIESLQGVGPKSKSRIEIVYFGNTFSPTYTHQVIEYLKHKNFCINVISKSGTTTETSLAFRLLKKELEARYRKEEVQKRIIATTDSNKGLLRKLANQEGYKTYVMPDDVGGRYSVFTPVGLLPIAVAGIDITKLINGAKSAYKSYLNADVNRNVAAQYAIIRNYMHVQMGKSVELYTVYEPHLVMLNEWLKQLFGESEGKEGKGVFPCSVCYSTDLHSLGQFVQDGSKIMFETNIQVEKPLYDLIIPNAANDTDELNYLANKNLSWVNKQAFNGTKKAHTVDGKVNNLDIILDELNEEVIGNLLYFFMVSCALSSYLLEINPFNQPGVEIYKKNMFELLGKVKK